MLALAGIPLGRRFVFLEPSLRPPAGALGYVVQGAYDDAASLERLASRADVVTLEFEAVPAEVARSLAARTLVRPSPDALAAAQDRLAEKRLFQELDIPTASFRPASRGDGWEDALAATGLPAVVKTRRFGYDGKGQAVVRSPAEAAAAVEALGDGLVVESFVDFDRELSIVGARGTDGSTVFYPLTENHHREGILRASYAPAPNVPPDLQAEAEAMAGKIMERFDYAGVLAVELFQCEERLLANEMAPRVHNSGHWTMEGAAASQFENHVRAVTGLPLAPAGPCRASAMLNLVGELPPLAALAAVPGARVHLYDKAPRPGRKLGHVNVTGASAEEAVEAARRVWRLLPEASSMPAPSWQREPPRPSRRDVSGRTSTANGVSP